MMVRREKMLISKHSITAPFFPVKRRNAFFSRRIPPVFVQVEYAFLRCPAGGAKIFSRLIYCPVNQANRR